MPSNFEELESCILRAAEETDIRQSSKSKSRMPDEIVKLIQNRRASRNKEQRGALTKLIRKRIRQEVRKRKDEQFDQILEEFKNLDRLSKAGVIKEHKLDMEIPEDSEFTQFLADVYAQVEYENKNIDHISISQLFGLSW